MYVFITTEFCSNSQIFYLNDTVEGGWGRQLSLHPYNKEVVPFIPVLVLLVISLQVYEWIVWNMTQSLKRSYGVKV